LALQQSDLEVLKSLGLTLSQAKVYLALIKTKPPEVELISKLTNISRPDVYRALSKLQNLGIVEKAIERPQRYKAVPPQEGITILLKRRDEEHDTLRRNSKLLADRLKNYSFTKPTSSSDRFVLIPKKSRMITTIKRAIDASQETVDLAMSLKRFMFGTKEVFAENHKKAWARGVRFRYIVEKPEEATTAEHLAQYFRKNSLCEARFLSDKPQAVIGIYDKREAFIILSPKEGIFNSPAVWSENPSFIMVIQDYFEHLWLTASEKL
jgi:sugar-specific transcriptional regulator TrmB